MLKEDIDTEEYELKYLYTAEYFIALSLQKVL